MGARDTKTYHVDIPVARVKAHENYNKENLSNDIAILYLAHDVDFSGNLIMMKLRSKRIILLKCFRAFAYSDHVRPICLPVDEPLQSRKFFGTNPWVAGWGYPLNETTRKYSDAEVLMQLQVPIVNNRVCKSHYIRIGMLKNEVDDMINDGNLCAGSHVNNGFWRGDSGSPLMLPIPANGKFPFYQIGLVSRSFSNARKSEPAIYTKLQYYADWIKKRVKE